MRASKTVVWILGIIIGLIVVLLIFRAGMIIGYRQAEYSSEWQHFHSGSSSPEMNSAGGRIFWRDASDDNGFLNDHGAIGTIRAVNPAANGIPSSIVVYDTNDNVEKTILLSATTTILTSQSVGGSATSSPFAVLSIGRSVAVIGMPDSQGQIVASIIRVLPASAQ